MKNKSLSFFMSAILLTTIIISTPATISQSDITITLEYSFSKPIIIRGGSSDGIHDSIRIEGLEKTHDTGKICLPVKPIKIIIPQGKSVDTITIKTDHKETFSERYTLESGARLIPLIEHTDIQKSDVCSISKKPVKTKEETNNLFSITGIYTWRGFNILYLSLYPVNYNEETGKVSYYSNMKVIIDFKDADKPIIGGYRGLPQDRDMVSTFVENPDDIHSYTSQYQSIGLLDTAQFLIITNEKLKMATGEKTFQDLLNSKINQGMTAKIVTIEEILENPDFSVNGKWGDNNPNNPFFQEDVSDSLLLFDDTQARIRNYIRYAYTELGTEYVLLAGDSDEIVPEDNIIPCRKLFADEEGLPLNGLLDYETDDIPSDVYYACLDGNFNDDHDMHFGESGRFNDDSDSDEADLAAEVWVGRACVDSAEEVSNFVSKTLWYEQTSDEYLKNIAFIGEYLGFPGVSAYGGNYKDYVETQVGFPERFTITKIYDREKTWDFLWLYEHLCSTSYHLINHDGHGNEYYMMKTGGDGIRYLTNEKPFFVYSHSCLTGSFDNWDCYQGYQEHDCIAEILTCEIPYGAFACILNARYGLGSEDSLESPSGAYDESFYKALFEENIRELGRASHYSKEDHIWQIDENGMRWCFYETNLFGDPSLAIKLPNTPPNKPVVQGNPQGKIGEVQYFNIYSVDNEGDDVFYFIDWGDGTTTNWTGPFATETEVMFNHTWNEKDTYFVKVKAKDVFDSESDWSTLEITMPLSKSKMSVFFSFDNPFLDKIFLYSRIKAAYLNQDK